MKPRIESIRNYILAKKQKDFWRTIDWEQDLPDKGDSRLQRAAICFKAVLEKEAQSPVFIPDERIVLTRTVKNLPDRYSDEEMSELRKEAYFHEKGVVFNMSPRFSDTIAVGLDARRAEVIDRREKAIAQNDQEGIEFLDSVLSGIDAVLNLADAYYKKALDLGLSDIAETLSQVPHKPARTFLEALQFLRILHFTLWCEGAYHNGIGRFDQFMYPYLKADLDAGRLNEEDALELLEEFFLSFNRDSDLYVGVQQGDNGQSMMLGGVDREGNDAVNLLTTLALKASCELKLIDPKINLRITAKTPLSLLEQATELTKQGLGFPQYANDDVIIPGLVDLGYKLEDARDYTVAACWEFIIPGCGMDIPNIDAVSFPGVVDRSMRSPEGQNAKTFDELMNTVRSELFADADRIEKALVKVDMLPCPFVSMLCDNRIALARDISEGSVYNNFGIHGTGFAPAVDSLEVLKKLVFEEKSHTIGQLLEIVDHNFEGSEPLLAKVRYQIPKLGNDEEDPDAIAVRLLDDFADSWKDRKNSRGGIFRAGTGSAMYYIWHANQMPASLDGRLKQEPFPANYAPSLNVQVKGPISVIKSFTKPHLQKVVNGGPLTIELHDSTFRNPDGITKVAQLVQLFAARGGHQLQINTINRDQLLAAQANPDQWKHLIVRVWGWSGYFIELDKPYQEQIIKRAEMVF